MEDSTLEDESLKGMVSEETELGATLDSERLGSEEGRAAVEDDSDEPAALERL